MSNYFLGVIYRAAGRIKEAEALFRKAIEINPRLSEAISELRVLQMRKAKEEKKGILKRFFG